MFVRWKKRPYALGYSEGVTYSAYLVESKRVDGKPRQQNRGYLGSIRKDTRWREIYWWHHSQHYSIRLHNNERNLVAFYSELRKRMEWLRLSDEQQTLIEQQISKVVPYMTREQCETCEQDAKRQQNEALIACMRR